MGMRNWTFILVPLFATGLLSGAPSLGRVPLSFEPGPGMSEFVARSSGVSVLLTPAGAAIGPRWMRLLGARSRASAQPEDRLPGYSNYLIDNNPRKWRTHVSNYRRVRYHDVYPGIDVVYYGNPRELEFDFIVAPGADPHRIQISISNPDLRIRLPRVYQNDRDVAGRVVRRANRVTFELAHYNRSQPLVIDPVLSYAAVFGGGGPDEGRAIAVDSTGAAYVIGNAFDGNFPVVNGRSGRFSFIAKLNPTGDALIYSTYLPWNGGGPASYAIDAAGGAYMTRDGAPAPGFPLIGPPPLRECSIAPPDVYVARLSPDGTSLVYSGCLGGAAPDYPTAIAVDAAGNAYVTGFTQSADFPLLNPLQSTHPAGNGFSEGFVLKLKADGTLAYSTFLGGGMGDSPRAIAVDTAGNAYVTGQTRSSDFPLKNAIPNQPPGSPNFVTAFIAKINPVGSALVYSTYFGGSNGDSSSAIAADAAGNTYVAGSTASTDFPTTKNAFQTRFNGVFLFKTTNGAATWTRSDSGLPGSSVVRVDPGNPSILYARSSGKLFKSTDRGATWKAAGDAAVSGLWINPTDSTLFISTPQGDILRSHDAGVSFTTLNTGLMGFVNQMVFDPKNPSVIYSRWGGSGDGDGVYKSVDGGDTWKPTGLTGSASGNGALAIDPVHPSTLYATRRTQGLLQSVDGGDTWTNIDKSLTIVQLVVDSASTLYAVSAGAVLIKSGDAFVKKAAPAPVQSLVIDPADGSTWYAITYASSTTGFASANIYKSTDGGDTWQSATNGLPNSPLITSLDLDPNSPGTLYLGSGSASDGFFAKVSPAGSSLQYSTYLGGRSTDSVNVIAVDAAGNTYLAGASNSTDFPLQAAFRTGGDGFVAKFDPSNALVWSSSLGGATPSAIAIGPANAVYLTGASSSATFPTPGAVQGFIAGDLFLTTDGGLSWTSSVLTTTGSVSAVAVDPKTPSRVYALTDHLYASDDGGQSWTQLGMPGISTSLFVDPQNPANMYASSFNNGLWKSTDGGVTFVQIPVIPRAPFVPIAALAIDPKSPSTLYAAALPPASLLPPGSGPIPGLLKSTDGGATWNPTGSPVAPAAVVVDPLNSAVLYGSFHVSSPTPGPTGTVAKSTDSGATWTTITNGLPSERFPNVLVVDPATPGRVYGFGLYSTNDLYRTDDGGNNWVDIGSPLPDWPINALAIDPTNPSILYAASGAGGLYRSTDAGASWSSIPELQSPIIHSIAIDPSDPSRVYTGADINSKDVFVMKIAQ